MGSGANRHGNAQTGDLAWEKNAKDRKLPEGQKKTKKGGKRKKCQAIEGQEKTPGKGGE